MKQKKVYISSMGITCPVGTGIAQLRDAIQNGTKGLTPIKLFKCHESPGLPVGEISVPTEPNHLPRTHQLAHIAAQQAMENSEIVPDAVVIGTTTGGMLSSENHLINKQSDRSLYQFHSIGSIAQEIARFYQCKGPAITVSTACSSGAVAIKIAMELLRTEKARHVLVGGVDSLCRLTYHGFKSLQLVDPVGARPFDKYRKGMNVAEGAAMMMLSVQKTKNVIAEILGAGLSCDAFHPAKPHPDGEGAFLAMQSAIQDAGICIQDIDYINLHGTGTFDNDLAEAKAINRLFPDKKPYLSSIKGALGHGLAASGAIEVVVSALTISEGIIPANIGYENSDPDLNLEPLKAPLQYPVHTVLSNSFGFGGNNAAIVISTPDRFETKKRIARSKSLSIIGSACLSGAGNTAKTIEKLCHHEKCDGMMSSDQLSENLSPNKIRRLKRLPRLALSLAAASYNSVEKKVSPAAIFLGTGWGALSETDDFMKSLFESDYKFPSPTSFVGSVHNSPGSHIAIEYQSTQSNITTCGGDHSFEQALFVADLMTRNNEDAFWLLGVDEAHPNLSSLFDDSVFLSQKLTDGGGALILKREETSKHANINLLFYENSENNPDVLQRLLQKLGDAKQIGLTYGAIFAGMPLAVKSKALEQLNTFLSMTDYKQPVIDYRQWLGEYASASATATVIAQNLLENKKIPAAINGGQDFYITQQRVLLLGLGHFITAVEVFLK